MSRFLLSSQSPFSSWREAYRFSGLPLIQPVLVREGNSRLTLFFPTLFGSPADMAEPLQG